MSVIPELATSQDIPERVIFPKGDLYSDEPPLETELHLRQIILLLQCLDWLWRDRNDFYVAGNLTIYYSQNQRKSADFRGPDFFVVLGTDRKPRKSWVVWEEDGKYPNVIVEMLSPTTANTDREFKKKLYQDTFLTPDYFWFDPYTLELAGFHLVNGKYQALSANSSGYLWSEELELYLGIHQNKLRFFTDYGELVPTPEEVAEMEMQRADSERQQKEFAQQRADSERQQKEFAQQRAEMQMQRADRLAAKLRELNIDPDTI
jgi:Uma2 family endonuclease